MAKAAEATCDAMPDYLWMADDPDEEHCWFAAPDADAAMVQARREYIGYFDQAHVAHMVITVWDAAEGGEEIGVIEFRIDCTDSRYPRDFVPRLLRDVGLGEASSRLGRSSMRSSQAARTTCSSTKRWSRSWASMSDARSRRLAVRGRP